MFTLTGHLNGISCLAFSPNGKALASGDQEGELILWELTRRRVRRRLHLPGAYHDKVAERVSSVVYSRDGKLLLTTTGTFPPFPRVWRAGDLALLHEWEGGFSALCAVFLPGGRYVLSAGSGDNDGDCPLYRWDMARSPGAIITGQLRGDPRTPQTPTLISGHTQDIFALDCSPGGVVVSGAADNTARLWDLENDGESACRPFRSWVRSVAVSPDGKLAAVASARTVYLWDLTRPAVAPRKLGTHTKTVGVVAFHPGGRIVGSGGKDGIVRLWDVQGGELQSFDWKTGWVGALAFAPDGDTAAAGGGSCDVVVFDLDL